MTVTNEQLVNFFHQKFDDLTMQDEQSIVSFLDAVLLYAEEIHLSTKDAQVLNELPLLAIISEVERAFPYLTHKLARDSIVLSKAVELVSHYPIKKRNLLRDHFLTKH